MSEVDLLQKDLMKAAEISAMQQGFYQEYVMCITAFDWKGAELARIRTIATFDAHLDQLAVAAKRIENTINGQK